METTKFRISITEYTTLKGFGNSCSIEKEFDTIDSVKEALKYSEKTLTEQMSNAHAVYCGSNMGFDVVDNNTNLVLSKIFAHPYTISEDGREYCYRGHRITTEFDDELGYEVLLVHRTDGRGYAFRSSLQLALDMIDWMCCSMENAYTAGLALDEANKNKGE